MLKVFVFLLTFWLFELPAKAGLGPTVPLSQVPSHLCILDFSPDESKVYQQVCSGVLLDSHRVLTAAHCMQNRPPGRILCGHRLKEVEFDSSAIRIHPEYQRNVIVPGGTALQIYDLAVIPLKTPTPIDKLKITHFPNQALDNSVAQDCAFFGFSRFSMVSKGETVGIERGWRVSLGSFLQNDSSLNLLRFEGLKVPGGLLQIGDSGGPLMCHDGSQWSLVGINSSRNFPATSNFVSVSGLSFLDSPGPKDSNQSSEIEQEALAKRVSFWQEISSLEHKIEKLRSGTSLYLNRLNHIKKSYNEGISTDELSLRLSDLVAEIQSFLIQNSKGYRLKVRPFSIIQMQVTGEQKSLGDMEYNFFEVKSYDLMAGFAEGSLRVFGYSDYFACGAEIICQEQELESIRVKISDIEIFQARVAASR